MSFFEPSRAAFLGAVFLTLPLSFYRTKMWNLIAGNKVSELQAWLKAEPHMAYIRSKDGRGPMFWAHEQRNGPIVKLLMIAGVPNTDKDAQGLTPQDLLMKDTK